MESSNYLATNVWPIRARKISPLSVPLSALVCGLLWVLVSPAVVAAPGFFFQYGINDRVISQTGPERELVPQPHRRKPSVAMGATGVSLVAWVAPDGVQNELYVRPVNTVNGAATLPAQPISSSNVEPAEEPTGMACSRNRASCLVVWTEFLNSALRGPWGRVVSAETGEPLGASFPLSDDVGTVRTPSVAHSPDHDMYLVGGTGGRVYLRRVDGAGTLLGGLGEVNWPNVSVRSDFDVAYDSNAEHFVIAFSGIREFGASAELGIFVAYVDPAAGGDVGEPVLVSAPSGAEDIGSAKSTPSVECCGANGRALVIWQADGIGATLDTEFEIYGQLLQFDPATNRPFEIGDDFRISAMNGIGRELGDATQPDLGFDPLSKQFLVTYAGTDPAPPFSPDGGEFEIYLQTVDDSPLPLISEPQRISDAGGSGDPQYDAVHPRVAATDGQAHVVWWAIDQLLGVSVFDTYDDVEIFGQMISLSGIFRSGFE